MRLFHFSDNPRIKTFVPRCVFTPTERPVGREWLNGPLVWAIDEPHQPMYLFPRECPRILLWPTPQTTKQDLEKYWDGRTCRMIAHVESAWLDRLRTAIIYRYELADESFEELDDAGMWVSRTPVEPITIVRLDDLPAQLEAQNVELRVVESLVPLRSMWNTSLHASGIRLRNSRDWKPPPRGHQLGK